MLQNDRVYTDLPRPAYTVRKPPFHKVNFVMRTVKKIKLLQASWNVQKTALSQLGQLFGARYRCQVDETDIGPVEN